MTEPIVSQETVSLAAANTGPGQHPRRRGYGTDWSDAEIAIISRDDLSPREMWLRLPHRTRRAIYVKRSRILAIGGRDG